MSNKYKYQMSQMSTESNVNWVKCQLSTDVKWVKWQTSQMSNESNVKRVKCQISINVKWV